MKRLFGIAATVLVLALLWLFFYLAEQRQSDAEKTALLLSHKEAFERELNQLSFVPKLLANDPSITSLLQANLVTKNPQSVFAAANARLKETQLASGLEFSFLLNRQGITIAASNWQDAVSFVGQDYSFRPYFQQAILGSRATYYAVGATTGIPGYFIAEPVNIDGITQGVVVAKVSLSGVAQSWGALGMDTLVVDGFGVVILSSDDQYLYQPTKPLTSTEIAKLVSERRYGSLFVDADSARATEILDFVDYRVQSRAIDDAQWRMQVVLPNQLVLMRSLSKASIAFAALLIAWLLYSLYRQQRLTVAAEQRVSRELEQQVKQRTQELEAIQKTLIAESNFAMLGRMSAAINHEVNQPLATLRLNLASLRSLFKEPSLNDNAWDSIQQIVTDSDLTTKRIARVITSLRSYAQRNRMDKQSLTAAELLQEVLATIHTERPNMASFIQTDIVDEPLFISGDSTLLQQGVLNLLYNAFDAVLNKEDPAVVIKAERCSGVIADESDQGSDRTKALTADLGPGKGVDARHDLIVISVIDNGDGIADTIKESLFEPFTTDRLHTGGLGLGLTITQQIIESHDGRLICDSSDQGSRFSMYLPACNQDDSR